MAEALPFEQVRRIKACLTDGLLHDLAAIFSRASEDALLLVYIHDIPPVLPEGLPAITLDDLKHLDLTLYDGVVIAYSSLDIIRRDIPTKGPHFYALDHILREHGLLHELRRSMTELSRYVLAGHSEWSDDAAQWERTRNRLLRMSAGSVIAGIPQNGLVALLPDPSLQAFAYDGRCRAVYVAEPLATALPPGIELLSIEDFAQTPFLRQDAHVFAMEEMCYLRNDISFADVRFIDLRDVLRRSGLATTVQSTLWMLATYLGYAGAAAAEASLADAARSLYVESELSAVDADDLIAVFPNSDLGRSASCGPSALVYRQVPEQAERRAMGLRFSLRALPAQMPPGYGQVCFSLPQMRAYAEMLGAQWLDLGPVLRRAGKLSALARSSWLLSRDLMWDTQPPARLWTVSAADLFRPLAHSYEIVCLEDPWQQRQGRYAPTVQGIYNDLLTLLARLAEQARPPAQLYYQAMHTWYACGSTSDKDIEPALHKMVRLLQDFEQKSRDVHDSTEQVLAEAGRLELVGEVLLHMLSGGGQPEVIRRLYPELEAGAISVPQVMGLAAGSTADTEVPSRLFRLAFRTYGTIIERIQGVRSSLIPIEDKIKQLRQNVKALGQGQAVVFALHHEQSILRLLYETAIKQTLELAENLQGSAQLDVEILTPSVVQHRDSVITLSVQNIGQVEAREIEVTLAESERFDLRDETSVKALSALPANGVQRCEFTINSLVNDDFPIRVQLGYRASPQREEKRDSEFWLRVNSLDQGSFEEKLDPYLYGSPLKDYLQFYGRRDELRSVLNHLAGKRPQNILLRGARRTGKTSVLYMLQAIIQDRAAARGVRSWFDIPQTWSGALDAIQPVLVDIEAIERRASTILSPTSLYQTILAAVQGAGWGTPFIEQMLAEPYISTMRFSHALSSALQAHPSQRLVLLVDEFDRIYASADKDFYAQLRHVISTIQGATWIIASALGLYEQVRDYESPLFNVFKIIDLRRLDPDAARRLILDPWQPRRQVGTGERPTLQFTDDAVDAILYETGCYPYFIQLLCSAIVNHANAGHTNYAIRGTVYDVIEQITAPRSSAYEHFAYLWDRAGGMGKAILLVLLSSVEPLSGQDLQHRVVDRLSENGINITVDQYTRRLQQLQTVEAIALDSSNRYEFGIPLFRRLMSERSKRENLWGAVIHELRDAASVRETHA